MSQKLRLKWDDFQENLNIAFGSLREDNEFADVTLASEDGQQMDAHKVILAASRTCWKGTNTLTHWFTWEGSNQKTF